MNQRVSPSSKNVALSPRKNIVFRNSKGGTPSHVKDCDKATSANYDLNHLDVVQPTAKATSPKTKHVHFFQEETSASPGKSRTRYGNSQISLDASKRGTSSKIISAKQGFNDVMDSHNSSACGNIRNDDRSVVTEVSPIKTSGKTTSARRSSSFNVKNSHSNVSVQRSNSLSVDEPKLLHNMSISVQIKRSSMKDNSHGVQRKDKRSLPAIPAEAMKTYAATSAKTSRPKNQKSPTGSRKDIDENPSSVRFKDPVLGSPNSKHKSGLSKGTSTDASLLKNNDQNSSSYTEAKQSCAEAQREISKRESEIFNSRVKRSHKSHQGQHCDSKEHVKFTDSKDSTVSMSDSSFSHLSPTKYKTPSASDGSGVSPSKRINTRRKHSDQSQSNVASETPHSTNLSSNTNLSSASLKRLGQLENDSQQQGIFSNLTPQSLTSSSASLNKDIPSQKMYDLSSLSPTPLSKLPRHGALSENLKISPVPSASSSSPSRPKIKTTSSFLGKDCVFGNGLDCIAAINLAQHETQSIHSSSSSLVKHRDATLSDLGPNFSATLGKKFGKYTLPFSGKQYDSLASLIKKESIAASYHLEYCWFCGRLMPPFGNRLSGCDEHLEKLAEMERRLAQAQSEKIKLVEEQVKMKESEIVALQKNEALEKELEQIKMREMKTQMETRSSISSLPNTSKDLDLRTHIENLGHQLDMCPHVTVTSHSCRGFLHKMGGPFKTWKKRWFVLDWYKRRVFYFTDKTETKLKGSVCFQAIEQVYVDRIQAVDTTKPKWTFCMKTFEKNYYLLAPSSETMAIWMDALISSAEGIQ